MQKPLQTVLVSYPEEEMDAVSGAMLPSHLRKWLIALDTLYILSSALIWNLLVLFVLWLNPSLLLHKHDLSFSCLCRSRPCSQNSGDSNTHTNQNQLQFLLKNSLNVFKVQVCFQVTQLKEHCIEKSTANHRGKNLANLFAANVTFWEFYFPNFYKLWWLIFQISQCQGSAPGLAKTRKLPAQPESQWQLEQTSVNGQLAPDTSHIFVSYHWDYLDKIHSCCRKITAINKQAWVTAINQRNSSFISKN